MVARASFRQDDVSRAVKGAVNAGLQVERVEVSSLDGRIVIVAKTPAGSVRETSNPWDSEFDEPQD